MYSCVHLAPRVLLLLPVGVLLEKRLMVFSSLLSPENQRPTRRPAAPPVGATSASSSADRLGSDAVPPPVRALVLRPLCSSFRRRGGSRPRTRDRPTAGAHGASRRTEGRRVRRHVRTRRNSLQEAMRACAPCRPRTRPLAANAQAHVHALCSRFDGGADAGLLWSGWRPTTPAPRTSWTSRACATSSCSSAGFRSRRLPQLRGGIRLLHAHAAAGARSGEL